MSLPTTSVPFPPALSDPSTVTDIGSSRHVHPGLDLSSPTLGAPDLLPPAGWPILQQALLEICRSLIEALPVAESAGVVVLPSDARTPAHRPTLEGAAVIGTAPAGEEVIQVEQRLGEGPVLTACRSVTVVTSADLAADERWRRFGRAVSELQLLSALCVPLPDRSGVTAGVLSLYSRERDAFDDRAVQLAAAIAHVITSALFVAEMVQRTRQEYEALREAAEHSAIINQAVGVLIRGHCTEEQARLRLARMAKRNDQDLAAAARVIVDEARTEAHLDFIVARRHS